MRNGLACCDDSKLEPIKHATQWNTKLATTTTQLQETVIDTHSFQTTSSDWKRLTREIALSDSLDNFRAAVSVVY